MEDKIAYYMSEEEFNEKLSKAVDAAIKAGEEKAKGKKDPDFIKVEKMLYAYPDLKFTVEQDKKYIEELKSADFPHQTRQGKSKDIVSMPSGSRQCEYDELEETVRSRTASMERTKREIARIEAALEHIRWKDKEKFIEDDYYQVIELKYFYQWTDEQIAQVDRLSCDPRTVRRNKNRLVNRLKNILIG